METNLLENYELVVGLEVHAQLLTQTKAYSSDKNEYGALPNTQTNVISLGHPGTLPKINQKVVEYAVKLGLACQSDIAPYQYYARKNYFYPDLPKGYQITQDKTPICTAGKIWIKDETGKDKAINITRIHMEEDAGKSIHDLDPYATLVDLNRAGVPLVEIVSEPDIQHPQEAYNYLVEVRKLLRYLEICDGNMEEGSMRCDVNVSIRKKGEKTLRQRVEVKNINSFRNVMRAIEYEMQRQAEVYETGGKVLGETRNFDAQTGTTTILRTKEGAADYRYFPEPDLPVLRLSADYINKVRQDLPPLPRDLYEKYTKTYGLSDYDANVLLENKYFALYYEKLVAIAPYYKTAANWLLSEVKGYLNQTASEIGQFPIAVETMAELISLVETGKVSHNIASKKIFPALLHAPTETAMALAQANDWLQKDLSADITLAMQVAMAKYPEKVSAYKAGSKNLLGLFVGEVMRATQGKADPKMVNEIVLSLLA
jgi:aspartyl-tRNA(Asn)/glutamyl-tRNA(Gln) amidotransferase subunit B